MNQDIQNLQRLAARANQLRDDLDIIWKSLQGLPDLLTTLTGVAVPGRAGQGVVQANQRALTSDEAVAAFAAFHVIKDATTGANGNKLDNFGKAIAALGGHIAALTPLVAVQH